MKVVAFNGSPRKHGNTERLIKMVLTELEAEGITTELIHIGAEPLRGCIACFQCAKNKDQQCAIGGDNVNSYINAMLAADGIIFGSPVYCADMTASLKALIERSAFVAKVNNDMFKNKVGAAVVAVRRCGASHTFSSINYSFLINQMIIPGSSYWNQGMGLHPGDVEKDEEGMRTMKILGKNMAWLLKKITAP